MLKSLARMRSLLHMTRERIIVLLLLIIPLSATTVIMLPLPAEFILRGKLVHVSDIGVKGSVYFTVVESGFTRNLYDRWSVYLYYHNKNTDIEFISIPREELQEVQESMFETETLAYSIEQAVAAAGSIRDDSSELAADTEAINRQRIDDLLSELDGYYGNSLGLMVAIGLYEEEHRVLFSELLQRRISGTGTMEEGGWIGSVGGLEYKLLGAEEEGIDIFFIPADYEWYGEFGNEAEARRVKDEHGLALSIVPVETFDEALQYLTNEIQPTNR